MYVYEFYIRVLDIEYVDKYQRGVNVVVVTAIMWCAHP